MMEGIKMGGKYFRKAICLLMCCLILNTSLPRVMALESGNIIDSSGIIGTPTWGDHTIIETDHGAIINWNNFNTSSGQIVEFRQYLDGSQNDMSAVLNRIHSGSIPTEFNGALNANGRVFIINPAGIIFGAGSTINVSQLVASGLNMSDWAFDAVLADPDNQMVFEGGDGNVTNYGTIQVDDSVYLIGNKIHSVGAIIAPGGLVVMAAGDNVYLAQDGSNVSVELDTNPGDDTADIRIGNIVSAANGTIVLAAGDTFSRAISNGSIIAASGGSITAHAARIENKGWMTVNSSSGDAGSINLTGVEEVLLSPDSLGNTGRTMANAGLNGDGGTITIESEGTVTLADNALLEAKGGSITGDGGHIQINSEHFLIVGDVDASPGNTDYEPGTLEVGAADVTIAAGTNLGAIDTIYEEDLEALSQAGTSLVVNAQDSITVQDIPGDSIIDGRFGNIEFYATGADSIVSFDDKTDTISTTLGDIVMEAGSGGIDIGNLETAKDESDISPTPGQITLTTYNAGDITTGNLTIKDGWGHAEINVNASGDLTVNGDVAVGRDSAINNIPLGADAEAMIYLNAEGNMVLEGDVYANADGTNEGLIDGITKSYIGISGGSAELGYGDVTINGDLVAMASSTSQGTSEATIEIDSWGFINWGPEAAIPVADADEANVESWTTASQEVAGNVAQILVNELGNAQAPHGLPDFSEIHMGNEITGNVLDNDFDPEGEPLTAVLVDGPSHAESFTLNEDGSYSYKSEPGYVGTDTFTYTASAGGGTTAPILVTITMTNNLPVAESETPTAHMGVHVDGTILDNISDADDDPLTWALVTDTEHGILTLNPDGTYTYEPDEGFVGTDSFTFSVADSQIDVEPVQATVTFTMTNTLPVAESETPTAHMGVHVDGTILDNISDADDDPLTWALVTDTEHGILTLNPDGTYTYEPDEGFVGTDSFTFSVADSQIDVEPVQATVTFTMTNSAPVSAGDAKATHMGVNLNGTLDDFVSDPDDDPLITAIVTETKNGTLTLDEDGNYTYKPDAGFVGTDSFTFTAYDGELAAEPVQFTATILVTNTQPAPNNDTAETVRGTSVIIDVLTNDSDPDGDSFKVDSFTYEGTGTLVLNKDNTFTYTPSMGFFGEESFTYTVSDGQIGAEPVETTVTIEVSLGYLPPAPLNMPTGPGLERTNIEISGCPALTKWVAGELGTDERMMEIFAVNGLASTVNIQPCGAYSNLKKAANILTDRTHLTALIQVINEYAFGNAPLSTEQMASIAEALARNTKTKNQYGIAEKYLVALSDYVSILSMELTFSPEESVQFAYEKYVDRLAEMGHVAVADYLAARLNSLSVFLSMSLMEPVNPYYEEW